jgi:hypothetical protein
MLGGAGDHVCISGVISFCVLVGNKIMFFIFATTCSVEMLKKMKIYFQGLFSWSATQFVVILVAEIAFTF